MKNLAIIKKSVMFAGVLIGNVTPVWAAIDGREKDNSGLFVWIFLGFCALIVVAQLIPAAMVLFGVVKGVKKKDKVRVTTTPEKITSMAIPLDETIKL